jgi:hypothetical protein
MLTHRRVKQIHVTRFYNVNPKKWLTPTYGVTLHILPKTRDRKSLGDPLMTRDPKSPPLLSHPFSLDLSPSLPLWLLFTSGGGGGTHPWLDKLLLYPPGAMSPRHGGGWTLVSSESTSIWTLGIGVVA